MNTQDIHKENEQCLAVLQKAIDLAKRYPELPIEIAVNAHIADGACAGGSVMGDLYGADVRSVARGYKWRLILDPEEADGRDEPLRWHEAIVLRVG